MPAARDAEVFAACERLRARVSECDRHLTGSCQTFASYEKREAARAYDCVAKLSCDDLANDGAIAACSPPASSFGDEMCSKLSACGSACTEEDTQELNQIGAWMRPEVLDVARDCLSAKTCGDAYACVRAFKSKVGL